VSKRKKKRAREALAAAGALVDTLKARGVVKPDAKVKVILCAKRRKTREGGRRV
jgi:hypothetical protein